MLLELIQGEGGVNVASKDYLKQLKNYCQKKNILFIVDEVQTGMGRTGEMFCYQHYAVTPDIMVLSKGLGAGVPISALVVKKTIADIIKPGMHASTFGGSPLVCKVSQEVFKIIKEEGLLEKAKLRGDYLSAKLAKLKSDFGFIKEARGLGLMKAVELDRESYPVFLKCLQKGLVINSTHNNVLRIMPALNVKEAELSKGLKILKEVFSSIR